MTDLTKVGINFHDILKKQVRNGNDTLFWLDSWCDSESLKDKFPELYQLERHKTCRVSQRVQAEGHTWEWRSTPASAEQIHSLRMLYDVIGEHQPTPEPDTWNCPLSEDGTFHVEVIRLKIDNVEPANNEVIIP